MATTIPLDFAGLALNATPEKVRTIVDWYESALGDSDKADSVEDASYYDGSTDAFESVLRLLHDQPLEGELVRPPTVELVQPDGSEVTIPAPTQHLCVAGDVVPGRMNDCPSCRSYVAQEITHQRSRAGQPHPDGNRKERRQQRARTAANQRADMAWRGRL